VDRLTALLKYHSEDPGDAFTRFALALEYLKAGHEEAALETFESLVVEQPDYVGTYYHLGALYLRRGRIESALSTYRTGVRVAERLRDLHARSELQAALLEAEGVDSDEH